MVPIRCPELSAIPWPASESRDWGRDICHPTGSRVDFAHEPTPDRDGPPASRRRLGKRPVQRLRLQNQVLADLPVPARSEGAVSSLDPRTKRFRVADKSLQQARHALEGATLALADLPRSNLSPVTAALEEIQQALSNIAAAAAQIDEARLEGDDSL